MLEYWESRFKNEGTMWKFEPSDSALLTLDLFKSNKIGTVLIPGCGYGRNAKLFYDAGCKVTGIEISQSAIDIAKENGLNCTIHHGSVTSMPFDNLQFDGIFCYALIHLLNKPERKKFLASCYHQLKPGGLMVFVVASKRLDMYGKGKHISKDRYEVGKGLKVYFYDNESIANEFTGFGLQNITDIAEPIKFMEGQEPMNLKMVICKKN